MKVIYKRKSSEISHLTLGRVYTVIGVDFYPNEPPLLCIRSDSDGVPVLNKCEFFDVLASEVPLNYGFKFFPSGFARLEPVEFPENFWDRYHNGDIEAEKLFSKVMKRLAE
jgi:hypothetical protein